MSLVEEESQVAGPAPQTAIDVEEGSWSELLRPRHLAATVTLCLGVALFAFNEFFVSTALPTAVAEFGGAALLSWPSRFTSFSPSSVAPWRQA